MDLRQFLATIFCGSGCVQKNPEKTGLPCTKSNAGRNLHHQDLRIQWQKADQSSRGQLSRTVGVKQIGGKDGLTRLFLQKRLLSPVMDGIDQLIKLYCTVRAVS